MTMPKKGRRKIVVNNKTYYYVVKKTFEHGYYGYKEATVTIQCPSGKFFSDPEEHLEITPSYIRKLIEENNL